MEVDSGKTYLAIVEDNNDESRDGRVRVRVFNIHGDDIPVNQLPWAAPWKDLNGNGSNVPEKGKIVMVVFESGKKDSPEYIAAQHYNINLEKKLESLSASDYLSMKSLIFDHKTQIYVNDKEGLKLDHKYNNVNITENTIDFNLKDNNRHVNIGDATAGQQAILGNHWMDWFDEFVDNLMGNKGGPYLGNLGAPVVANPALIQVLQKYKALRDPVFLSHHVNIVDNNKVSTVKNTRREDNPQLGDAWTSTVKDNNLTKKTNDNFKPVDGPKPEYNDKHVEPVIGASGSTPTNTPATGATSSGTASTAQVTQNNPTTVQPTNDAVNNPNPPAEPLSSPTSNPKIDKLIKFMESKKYTTYDTIGYLNIVAFQSSKKDNGEVSNKFDDTLNVFYKNQNGNWELLEYQITTMPGYVAKTDELPIGNKLLSLGQYVEQCRLDDSNPKNKVIIVNECTMHNNDSTKIYNYKSPEANVKSIPLLHKSSDIGSAEYVFNYSTGAHVFKTVSQWDQFITLCENQINVARKKTFSYTFAKQSEFDNFVPSEPVTTPKVTATNVTSVTKPVATTPTTPTTSTTPTKVDTKVVSPSVEEQKSFNDYQRIVKIIENIYRLGDNNFTGNSAPLFKDFKGTISDDTSGAFSRLYELLGLKTMKIKQFWYNKLPISGLTINHQQLFKNQLIGLKSATMNKSNSFNFNLPTLRVGEGVKNITIKTDF